MSTHSSALSTPASAAVPALFVSHGAPLFALEAGETGPALTRWGQELKAQFPGLRGVVPRWSRIRYTGFDPYGDPIDRTVDEAFEDAPYLIAATYTDPSVSYAHVMCSAREMSGFHGVVVSVTGAGASAACVSGTLSRRTSS